MEWNIMVAIGVALLTPSLVTLNYFMWFFGVEEKSTKIAVTIVHYFGMFLYVIIVPKMLNLYIR